tara:strand:- start:212 stop:610 length:399 start_codon:yes stop_codon:yes gene_type:complete
MIKTILAILLALSSTSSIDIGATITPTYNIHVTTVPTHVKETGMANAIIKPAEGYKWNEKYPASFEFMHYESAVATPLEQKTYFKKGKLCVPYVGKLEGKEPIVVAISFSICNEESCFIYRKQKVILSLMVN